VFAAWVSALGWGQLGRRYCLYNARWKITLRVVGDTLVLDTQRFASLVRRVDQAPGNVQRIVFDARNVRIVEPVTLQTGNIQIFARTVSFEGRGALILSRPQSGGADGIQILAARVDLSAALPIALQVIVRKNGESQKKMVVRSLEQPARLRILGGEIPIQST
jgi:hypothetical protein